MRGLVYGLCAIVVFAAVPYGCASHGRGERAGRAVDRGVDAADEKADEAGDAIERGVERGKDKTERAVDELKK